MRGTEFWPAFKFVIPGAGVGFLLMGGWTWYAVPPPDACAGALTCTQVFIPGGMLAGVLLAIGGLLTIGWGLGVGFRTLLKRSAPTPTRVTAPPH
jgi:hypothetical protein